MRAFNKRTLEAIPIAIINSKTLEPVKPNA